MRLPRVIYDALKLHALEEAPRECCGMIACQSGQPVRVYRASNVALDPTKAYKVDPDDQLYVGRQLSAQGLTLGAVYHSHPCSNAQPSLRDMVAPYPTIHIIMGMGQGFVMAAWRIETFDRGHTAKPVELEVV